MNYLVKLLGVLALISAVAAEETSGEQSSDDVEETLGKQLSFIF